MITFNMILVKILILIMNIICLIIRVKIKLINKYIKILNLINFNKYFSDVYVIS